MKRKNFIILTIKLVILISVLTFSIINFKATLSESLNDTNQLTFIKAVPEQNYILQKYVYISGAVEKPGVYELSKDDTRLGEVIQIAGGLSKDANLSYISQNLNLASIVKDSDHIDIPTISVTSGENKSVTTSRVNLNTATLQELDTLPGIGEATAQKIIDARPFASIEDIKEVSGIGDSKFNQIKDLITTE